MTHLPFRGLYGNLTCVGRWSKRRDNFPHHNSKTQFLELCQFCYLIRPYTSERARYVVEGTLHMVQLASGPTKLYQEIRPVQEGLIMITKAKMANLPACLVYSPSSVPVPVAEDLKDISVRRQGDEVLTESLTKPKLKVQRPTKKKLYDKDPLSPSIEYFQRQKGGHQQEATIT